MRRSLFIVATAMALMSTVHVDAQEIAPFKQGDRVAFVGNSITDGGHYHSYIWLYYMTRFPYRELRMFNCGVGGDTSENILNRLDGDIFSTHPTVLTLTFGMNDSGYYEYNGDNPRQFADERVAFARKYFSQIETRLKGLDDTRIVMIGTSPYDETAQIENVAFKNKNAAMRRIIEFQRAAAEQNRWEFLDYNAPMTAINTAQQQTNPAFTLCGSDRIHPDNDGHMVMAYLFLKAQGMAGVKVADVTVDSRKANVVTSDNCEISHIKKSGRTLSFDYLAGALPYPLDTIARGWGQKKPQAAIRQIIPSFVSEMNTERLCVTGLKGNYRLLIDDEPITTLTAKELADGINLTDYPFTPQYQQALAVMALNEERWDIERRFRDYAWLQYNFFMKHGLLDANNQKAVAVFKEGAQKDGWVNSKGDLYGKMIHPEVRQIYLDQIELITRRIYELNKPLTRRVVIEPMD
jgi:lysophospholipase L1-like esterase